METNVIKDHSDCPHDVVTMTDYCADCHAVFSPEAGWFHPRRADEPRVAEGLSEQEWPEPCCYLNHEVDEPCGLPPVKVVFTQTMDSIPAPRVAEPSEAERLRDALVAEWDSHDEAGLIDDLDAIIEAARAPRPPEPDQPCQTCRDGAVLDESGRHITPPDWTPTRPPEPDRTADGQDVIDAINKAYWAGHEAAKAEPDRTAALEAENERLRADLATFTGEPDIRVRLEADRVTYWYNQTRLMDAKAERYRAALEWIAGEGGVGVHTSDCRCATHEASRALAATPEPAPVADGTVCGFDGCDGETAHRSWTEPGTLSEPGAHCQHEERWDCHPAAPVADGTQYPPEAA